MFWNWIEFLLKIKKPSTVSASPDFAVAYAPPLRRHYYSHFLQRTIYIDIFSPTAAATPTQKKSPFLVLNDGQDAEALRLGPALNDFAHQYGVAPVVFALHTNERRLQEYGTAHTADYKGRGALAAAYTQCVVRELLPWLRQYYLLEERGVIAGCSLGGLSAFDIGWHCADVFKKVGVFSGSFWWNDSAKREESERIVPKRIAQTSHKPALKFWFQAGTNDETDDRNNNGIIDAIDDTLDVIVALAQKGFRPYDEVVYVEVENGKHDTATWAAVLPDFLKWAFVEK